MAGLEKREEIRRECQAYFKARPIYRQLFQKIREKYESLGHLGGKVSLSGLTKEEKAQLGGFFQKDYTEKKKVTISASLMEKALSDSRFAVLAWEEILEDYFGRPLVGKKEKIRREEQKRESYFGEILEKVQGKRGEKWLEGFLRENKEGRVFLNQNYKERPEVLKETLFQVIEGIEELPLFSEKEAIQEGKTELLPVYSARVTGNPHYFDQGTLAERLILYFLEEHLEERGDWKSRGKGDGSSLAEYKKRLWYEAGILKDQLSNDVLAYGIQGWKKNGELHLGIQGFLENQEPVKLTLQTLGRLGRIEGRPEEPIYVVENPAVFSVLTEKGTKRCVVCGNGQLKLAVLVLLDKLSEKNCFYYAGDFDPEGLLIAQRLKLRYGEKLKLWNYKASWYEACKSQVELSGQRLKKLDKVFIEELQEIKEAIKKEKKAAYQEAMLGLDWEKE